jgi:DNA-binding winged helix-turn-helix (wHTH) protein
MEEIPKGRLVRFGIFEAEPQTGELRKQGRRVPLQGQPFDILVMLLERPGQLVSRTEIRERLWPNGTFVDFDHSLNTAVNKIRDVLGDSAASPRFIETLARRGYRFIAPVQVDGGDSASNEPTKTEEPNRPEPTAAPETSDATALAAEKSINPSKTILTASHEIPPASRSLVRTLFLLLQVMYFCFYLISLARLHVVEEIIPATFSRPSLLLVLLIITAVVGIPTRLYLITAAAFKAPGLREKFLRLFPLIFPLDELWALAPFLLVQQIGYGLALGLTAILLYAPFAERSLILMGAGGPAKAGK